MNKKISSLAILAIFLVAAVSAALLFAGSQPDTGMRLKKFSSYDDLAGFLKTKRDASVYPGGYGLQGSVTMLKESTSSAMAAEDYSATNIQVEGVDEADIVKNDGKYIYILSGRKLVIADAYPAEEARILSETTIEGQGDAADILLNKDRLAVFERGYEKMTVKTQPDDVYTISGQAESFMPSPLSAVTRISVYDISDREKPVLARSVEVSGYYYGSRMIGDYVYAVANQPAYYYGGEEPVLLPEITENNATEKVAAQDIYYFDMPDYNYNYLNIVSVNTQDDSEEHSSRTYLAGSAQNMYVSTENIYVTYTIWNDIYTAENMIDEAIIPVLPTDVLKKVEAIKSSGIEASQKIEQISAAVNAYLNGLGDEEKSEFERKVQERRAEVEEKLAKARERTAVHKIAISGGKIDYKGQGSVPGHVLNQFSMDEHNGYFRIATTTTTSGGFSGPLETTSIQEKLIEAEDMSAAVSSDAKTTIIEQPTSPTLPSPPIASRAPTSQNNIYVLDENLKVVGAVEDLAPGESIYSARFMGDRAYLVTFVKIDPLFVIELSEPTEPKVLGKLKIPGYSDYLHPYDENHIIGVGKEAVGAENGDFAWYQGVKLALFDVTDPESPKEISKYEIGDRGTDSEALRDHKAFLFDRQKNLLVIPVLLAEIDKTKYAGEVPLYAYGDYKWQGAYVFSLDTENGFRLKGRITHGDENDDSLAKSGWYYYGSVAQVKRSLYMDDVLYTISGTKIKMNDLSDLREINSVKLPGGDMGIAISY